MHQNTSSASDTTHVDSGIQQVSNWFAWKCGEVMRIALFGWSPSKRMELTFEAKLTRRNRPCFPCPSSETQHRLKMAEMSIVHNIRETHSFVVLGDPHHIFHKEGEDWMGACRSKVACSTSCQTNNEKQTHAGCLSFHETASSFSLPCSPYPPPLSPPPLTLDHAQNTPALLPWKGSRKQKRTTISSKNSRLGLARPATVN